MDVEILDRLQFAFTIFFHNIYPTLFFVICILLLSFYTLLYVPHLSGRIRQNAWMFAIPVLMVLSIANITRQIAKRSFRFTFFSSALTVSLLLIIIAIELYSNLLLSTTNPAHTLTVHNAASSSRSLQIQLLFVAVGVPLTALYTLFVFGHLKEK